jgi:hypothetical protein
MYSLSALMTFPDEEFDVLGEDELALLTRRFERLHEPVEHKDDNSNVLSVRQAGTLRRRLPREDGEQGRLQALVNQGRQVSIEARSQAQGRVTVEEEG